MRKRRARHEHEPNGTHSCDVERAVVQTLVMTATVNALVKRVH